MKRTSLKSISPRQGHSLILVVAVIVLCGAITVTATQTTLKQYRLVENLELKLQADCLAESARLRVASALLQSHEYAGETWEPVLPDPARKALVAISRGSDTIHIQVQYPANRPETSQVRVTRSYSVSALLNAPGN